MKKIKLQINSDIFKGKLLCKKGDILRLKTDKGGMILDRFWRDRVKDSEIDSCVSISNVSQTKKEKKEE